MKLISLITIKKKLKTMTTQTTSITIIVVISITRLCQGIGKTLLCNIWDFHTEFLCIFKTGDTEFHFSFIQHVCILNMITRLKFLKHCNSWMIHFTSLHYIWKQLEEFIKEQYGGGLFLLCCHSIPVFFGLSVSVFLLYPPPS